MIMILQRRVPPVVAVLITLILVTSLAAVLGDLYGRLALVPSRVWHGELWRLATWILVQHSPLGLILGCVTLFWFGGALEWVWGSRRFGRRLAAVVLIAAIGTSLLALALPGAWGMPYFGSSAITSALLIAWALQFPERRIRVYLVLVVGGPTLAYGVMLVTILFAVFYGVAPMLPELLAAGAALAHMTGTPSRWRQALRRWRAHRRFGVVRGGRHGGPYDWN